MSVMNLRPRSNITLNPMLMFTGDEHLPHKCVFTKLLNCWNELPIDIRLLESYMMVMLTHFTLGLMT